MDKGKKRGEEWRRDSDSNQLNSQGETNEVQASDGGSCSSADEFAGTGQRDDYAVG
jgi:hypothetical protein